jgi:hypothetical protein
MFNEFTLRLPRELAPVVRDLPRAACSAACRSGASIRAERSRTAWSCGHRDRDYQDIDQFADALQEVLA